MFVLLYKVCAVCAVCMFGVFDCVVVVVVVVAQGRDAVHGFDDSPKPRLLPLPRRERAGESVAGLMMCDSSDASEHREGDGE